MTASPVKNKRLVVGARSVLNLNEGETMKKKLLKFALMGAVAAVPTTAMATDFFDVIGFQVSTVGTTSSINVPFNGAVATATWQDVNQNGQLDANEVLSSPVVLMGRDESASLASPSGLTRAGLESWAEAHATEIYKILFPGGVSQGITDVSMAAQTSSQRLFQKAKLKKTQAVAQNSEFSGALEYNHLKVDDASGNAYSAVMGYSHDTASGLEVGISVPYRFTSMSDSFNSKSHFLEFEPYLKKKVMEQGDMSVSLGGSLLGSVFYMKSDAIEHSGNLTYGGGLFASFTKELGAGTLSGGLDYKLTKAYLPSGLNSGDNIFVDKAIDYVNDLDPVHTVSYGLNYGVPVRENLAVNLQIVRSNFISSDIESERDSQTVVGLGFSYLATDTFEINLGVRSIYELKNVDSYGVMLNSIWKF